MRKSITERLSELQKQIEYFESTPNTMPRTTKAVLEMLYARRERLLARLNEK